jgi:Rrf2 family protein
MLSKKCKYAIHALVYLAERYQKGPVHIQEIADDQRIPKKFLEAILLELRNANILHSKKGKGGGYYLYKDPSDVNLIEIIRLMDGAIAMLPCVSLNYYEPCEECVDEHLCGIRDAFIGVRDETLRVLATNTLAHIVANKSKKEVKKIHSDSTAGEP